jgi:hypothetical protein
MKIEFEDQDLKELIETGHNKKYKKFSKVKDLMNESTLKSGFY